MSHTLSIPFVGVRREVGAPLIRTRPCGHPRHVGVCPSCQRVQLARWAVQLADVSRSHNAR
jgi:hypothetical protein